MIGGIRRALGRWLPLFRFGGSEAYWRARYQLGGDSGVGSEGAAARYKADVLNRFVRDNKVTSVIEFGCGDGRQLQRAEYPAYLGLDISEVAIDACRARFAGDAGKRFETLVDYRDQAADLALSIDVLFHLVEDSVYLAHLDRLFRSGERFVVVYTSDEPSPPKTLRHVRHRHVTADIARRYPDFARLTEQEERMPAPPPSDQAPPTIFLFFERTRGSTSRSA